MTMAPKKNGGGHCGKNPEYDWKEHWIQNTATTLYPKQRQI